MDAGTPSDRPRSLVVELAAGTVNVDGQRIELPPTELAMLAVLAARPGEVVSHKELCDATYIPSHDLHWRVWKLRKLLGDKTREHKIIGNRRGVGYVLDLPPNRVQVIQGVAAQEPDSPSDAAEADRTPAQRQEVTTEQEPIAPSEQGATLPPKPEHVSRSERARRSSRFVVRPAGALAAILIASLTLGGSWLAGYRLSQRSSPGATDAIPRSPQPSATSRDDLDARDNKQDGAGRTGRDQQHAGRGQEGPNDEVAGILITPPSSQGEKLSDDSKSSGGAQKPEPPPPQPDAQLFHLHHPDSGERYTTISSATANQKQAAGYNLAVEGRVFTTQVKGTTQIALHDGSAYVYRSRDVVPKKVSVTELYRLTRSGDFFYTKSSSSANQAEAQGWSRSVTGFVQ